jgi:hypothetical protein
MCPVFGSGMESPISLARWLQETRKMRFERFERFENNWLAAQLKKAA